MPKFYQIEGQPTIYKDPELKQGFKSEQEFIAAGGTKYWDPKFTGQSNVTFVKGPASAPTEPISVSKTVIKQPTEPPKEPVQPVQAPKVTEPPKAPKITAEAPTGGQLPYVRHPNGIDVYDRAGNYISAAKATQIPNFWDMVGIDESAPNTSKGQGLGGPVEGNTDLPYVTYNGIDVYNKATGEYIDFDTAKKLDIWNKIETMVDSEKLKELGIDETGGEVFKSRYGIDIPKSPYQAIYDDFKVGLDKTNDALDKAWLDYNLAVVDIEENPWLLTGEQSQALKKLKKTSLAKINALTATKSSLLESFNMAVGITEREEQFQESQLLTIAEAEKLGVAFGTSRQDAIDQGLIPGAGEVADVDTQVVTAGGRTLLINKTTGETIKDLGGAYKSGGGGVGGGGDPSAVGLSKKELTKLNKDRDKYWTKAQKGDFGVEGAREKILTKIKNDNPSIDQQKIVDWMYGVPGKFDAAIPDGYESSLEGGSEAGLSTRLKSIADILLGSMDVAKAISAVGIGELNLEDDDGNVTSMKFSDKEIDQLVNYFNTKK